MGKRMQDKALPQDIVYNLVPVLYTAVHESIGQGPNMLKTKRWLPTLDAFRTLNPQEALEHGDSQRYRNARSCAE
jgi:hypothetical protein